jgi:hypothetical protein
MSRHADCCFANGANVGSGRRCTASASSSKTIALPAISYDWPPARMQLADHADALAVELDRRAAPRMQRRMRRRDETCDRRREKRLDVGLGRPKKSTAALGPRPIALARPAPNGEASRGGAGWRTAGDAERARGARPRSRTNNLAQLEDANARPACARG